MPLKLSSRVVFASLELDLGSFSILFPLMSSPRPQIIGGRDDILEEGLTTEMLSETSNAS